jgi:hypothetical protein
VPKPDCRRRATARLEAVKATVLSPPVRKLRRVRDSDWKGAVNRLVARHAAATLRNVGFPLPTEICKGRRRTRPGTGQTKGILTVTERGTEYLLPNSIAHPRRVFEVALLRRKILSMADLPFHGTTRFSP